VSKTNPSKEMTEMSSTRTYLARMESIYRRVDGGQLTGRNSTSTDRTLDRNWRLLLAALENGGYEECDADERLAARWARIERRYRLGEGWIAKTEARS
jgi:hypothetical protein